MLLHYIWIQLVIPATQIQNSNAEIPNAEIPNPKSQIPNYNYSGNNSWYHPTLENAANWLRNNNPLFHIYNYFYTHGNSEGFPLNLLTAILITNNSSLLQRYLIICAFWHPKFQIIWDLGNTYTIGTILSSGNNSWYHPTLENAANWLRNNNPLFHIYNYFYTHGNSEGFPLNLLTAILITNNSSLLQRYLSLSDLVIQNQDFDNEIHNENYHFSQLITGFLTNSIDKELPISYNDPNLEALLFLDLFSLGKGHYKNQRSLHEYCINIDTYSSYIRLHYTCPDPRFCLSWYWPHISYLNLEKLQNHQNHICILKQKAIDREHLPIITNLITNSIYSNISIVNEIKTTTVPSYIRTEDTYWHQKEHHLNIILHHFERDEFQNRGVIHTHGVVWLDKSITELIDNNVIQADLPNPETETELYHLVTSNNIHHCNLLHCNGPAPPGQQYKQGFPQPLSDITYHHPESSDLFEIHETDAIKRHVHARRLGSMELTILILGKPVSRSSIAVVFLPSTPPENRQ
ncbi:hypothetical protein Glove_92g61 [Diversispora epigaea]|uniref:Helitron helicase-like domain-containing protein n=1 Tax=Diversispora epigaea TaxID=1348612 RepID=A0A397J9J8_9GLOM|nr:hypothetical protein Glove_92g61 [Diversispora epigaea]